MPTQVPRRDPRRSRLRGRRRPCRRRGGKRIRYRGECRLDPLEQDISSEPVGHHHVGPGAGDDIVALDRSNVDGVGQRVLSERGVSRAAWLVALARLGPDREESDPGMLDPGRQSGVARPEGRVLDQVDWMHLNASPDVEQDQRTANAGQDRRQRRATDAGKPAGAHDRRGHDGTTGPGRDHGPDLA